MERGAWRAAVHGISKSRTQFGQLNKQQIVDLQHYASFRYKHSNSIFVYIAKRSPWYSWLPSATIQRYCIIINCTFHPSLFQGTDGARFCGGCTLCSEHWRARHPDDPEDFPLRGRGLHEHHPGRAPHQRDHQRLQGHQVPSSTSLFSHTRLSCPGETRFLLSRVGV